MNLLDSAMDQKSNNVKDSYNIQACVCVTAPVVPLGPLLSFL